jgi:hypothetical protein
VTVYGPAGRRSLTDLIPTVPSLVAFFLTAWLYATLVWTEGDAERWVAWIPENPVIQLKDRG